MFAYTIGRKRLRKWLETFYVSEKKLGIKDFILYALNNLLLLSDVIMSDYKEINFQKNEELSTSVDPEGYEPEDTYDLKLDDRTVTHTKFGDISGERSFSIFLKHPEEDLWRKAWEFYVVDKGKITENEISTIRKFNLSSCGNFSRQIRNKLNVTLPPLPPAPNLCLTDVKLPYSVHSGETFTITLNISNTGNLVAKDVEASIYIDERKLSCRPSALEVGDIRPDQTITVNFTLTAQEINQETSDKLWIEAHASNMKAKRGTSAWLNVC